MSDATRYWSSVPGHFMKGDVVDVDPKCLADQKQWSETLITQIVDTINDLQKLAFAKYGRAKRLQNDLFINLNLIPYVENSVLFQKSSDDSCYGKVADMKIHIDNVFHGDRIRIISEFDVNEDPPKMYHGTVMIVNS
jgi:hypothetical protein